MQVSSIRAFVACNFIVCIQAFRTKVNTVISHNPGDGPDPTTSFDAIWHIALRPCIEGKADVRRKQELTSEMAVPDAAELTKYATEAWQLDFELNILNPRQADELAEFGKQWHETFKRGLLSYFNGTNANERRTLKEERYNDLLQKMEFEHEFFYTSAKQECQEENRQKHESSIQPLLKELENGCQGSCSKLRDACAEPEDCQCPEGTKCQCLYVQDKTKALKVSAVTYITFWLFNTIVFWGHGGYAMPGPMEASIATAFLFATETVGCQCRPLQCHWNAQENSCEVETQDLDAEIERAMSVPTMSQPTALGKNAHISKMPFPGFKCEPQDTYNAFGFKTSTPTCSPVPCTPLEYGAGSPRETRVGTVSGKLGKSDGGIYNCWSLTSKKMPLPMVAAAMPVYAVPQDTRSRVYDELMLERDPRARETMEK